MEKISSDLCARVSVLLFFFALNAFAIENLDIRVLRVEFKKENPDNSLTTGLGTFDSSRGDAAYWEKHIKFAKNYFEQASNSKVSINAEIYPKNQSSYKLEKEIISYNRTSRREGEKMAEFDSVRAADYARFVNDVLKLANNDPDKPLAAPASSFSKRVILIAHAGNSRLLDGGTMGTRGANTPGDFTDAYIDTSWGEFWRGFEVSEGDTITSVMVTSETANQDGLKWGIEGTITSQIGRELGLPYSFDVVKGFSRLGYFDGMDFAGYNAGDGFRPTLPSAWMRKKWIKIEEVNKNDSLEICAAACDEFCTPQAVKIPINHNEYILLENRQKTCREDGAIDSSHMDVALPASGIAAWHINEWYVKELLSLSSGGAVNAWGGDTFRDHQYGIALIEASGILGLGKEFRNGGENNYYFGSGSDLIPHKRTKSNTVFSINPSGYGNTASTFGGYSGIKITAKIPDGAKEEKSFNGLIGDSVTTWRALKMPVKIEWIGKYARPIPMDSLPFDPPKKEDFAEYQIPQTNCFKPEKRKSYNLGNEEFLPICADINKDGIEEAIFLGNNRLYAVDSNGVPLPNFPVLLSNGEPFENFRSRPVAIDITGNDSLEILIPVNNGLILAVNGKGKLLKEEFPITAGTFSYKDTVPMFLLHKNTNYLFAMHRDRDSIKAFYLPEAREFLKPDPSQIAKKDEISEFFIYPSPVRGGKAAMRFRIMAPAASATLDVFDITGFKVFSQSISDADNGSNQVEGLDFSKLGSDVYSARLTVKFKESGKRKEKWVRVGVIR
jgi:hypothetical protein